MSSLDTKERARTVRRYRLPRIAGRRPHRTIPVENVRARIAYALLSIFAGTNVFIFVATALNWASASDLRQFETPLMLEELSLLGGVVWFYFLSRADRHPPAPPTTAKEDDEDED